MHCGCPLKDATREPGWCERHARRVHPKAPHHPSPCMDSTAATVRISLLCTSCWMSVRSSSPNAMRCLRSASRLLWNLAMVPLTSCCNAISSATKRLECASAAFWRLPERGQNIRWSAGEREEITAGSAQCFHFGVHAGCVPLTHLSSSRPTSDACKLLSCSTRERASFKEPDVC